MFTPGRDKDGPMLTYRQVLEYGLPISTSEPIVGRPVVALWRFAKEASVISVVEYYQPSSFPSIP